MALQIPVCDHCNRRCDHTSYRESDDAYWCDSCHDNADEAAAMRQMERDLASPPETLREEQIRTWNEHQRLHKR